MNVKRLLISLILLIISNNLIVFSEPLDSTNTVIEIESVTDETNGQLDTTVIYAVNVDDNITIDIKSENYQETLKQEQIENEKWITRETEYPTATYIWKYLKNLGLSDAAAAGILGNMMTEVGGWVDNIATMNLDVYNNHNGYYGICQWKKKTHQSVVGADLESQLNFLATTLPTEYAEFGSAGGYDYNSFIALDNPSVAALSFAKTYERCTKKSYARRQRCAEFAYNYFTT